MRVPVMTGVIDRRILVNFRVRPEALRAVLPEPFEPQLVGGWGMAGICLIRLRHIRPRCLPLRIGIASENAAHRGAVAWDDAATGARRTGVWVPRRDTSAWANALAGGRIFPGEHHRSRFDVDEADDRFDVRFASRDGETRMHVRARRAADLPAGSVFGSLAEASAFFEAGSLGYSATSEPGVHDGLELRSFGWRVEPLAVEQVASSFFDDAARFPAGSVELDHALLMRGIEHEWHARAPLCCSAAPASAGR